MGSESVGLSDVLCQEIVFDKVNNKRPAWKFCSATNIARSRYIFCSCILSFLCDNKLSGETNLF